MKYLSAKVFLITVCWFSFFMWKNVKAQYCTTNLYSGGGCIWGDYIDDVSLDSISQTNTGCGLFGYSDYTNMTAHLEQGSTYTLFLSTGNYGEYASLWIDYNDDYVFDTTEKVISDLYCESWFTYYSANFMIDGSAPLGNHRMRLRIVQYTVGFDACSSYADGEVHDYTVNIIPPSDMTYASSTATQDAADTASLGASNVVVIGVEVVTSGTLNPLSLTSFTFNSNGSTDFTYDVSDVKVYYTGTSPIFSTGNEFGSATDLSSPITGSQELSQGTNYFWVTYDVSPTGVLGDYLDGECTSLTVGGTNYTPTVTSPAGNVQLNYCTPVDLFGCYYCYIDGVKLNTLSNTFSYCNGMATGYIKYEPIGNLTTSLEQGNSYTLVLHGSNYDSTGFGVWVDYNNDGDFDDASEFVFSSASIDTGSQVSTITIPPTVSIGEHRMRIRSKAYGTIASNESCSQFNYGETEDYTITITPLQCYAGFTMYPDSLIPHHYWAVSTALGTPPLNYYWIWGDGTYDTTAYPSHTYDTAGFYNICLVIIDATGCGDSMCINYEVLKSSSSDAVNTVITVDVVDSIPDIATGIASENILQSFSVYPNPASENVFVNYSLSSPATVNIELYDVLGNKLQELSNDFDAGEHHSIIDTRKFSNGVYYLKIQAGEQIVSQKIVVVD